MAIDSDYIKQQATQLANYEVQSALAKANRTEARYKAQLSAVTTLESSLRTFGSAVKGLKSLTSNMLVNSAALSHEGIATASVGLKAIQGSYDFFVEQLASRHQFSIEGLQDGDIDTSGSLTIGQGDKSFTIDLSTIDNNEDGSNSLAELASAINKASDNTGVKATLVRSNGQVSLVLASEKTGADNAITLSTSNTSGGAFDTAIDNKRELSQAQDAKVRLGGEDGMVLTNASNTFNEIIDGVSLTFTKAHKPGDQPLTVGIDQDKTATKEKAQSFVTALNTLMSSFDTLTASGGENGTRGPLAGDSSIRAIENMLNQALRGNYGGATLMDFGITSDRNGKLTIDSDRFEKALAEKPEAFEKLFKDKGGLLETIDKSITPYTNSANGVMKTRKESLNLMLRRMDDQFDNLQKQYDNYYSRYLKQYTSMMQTMSAMESTFGMF